MKCVNLQDDSQLTMHIIARALLMEQMSISFITTVTNISGKKLNEMKRQMIKRGLLIERKLKSSNDCFSAKNLSDRVNLSHYYSCQFLTLYRLFHQNDPTEKFDIEAMLKAWNILRLHCPEVTDKSNLNSAAHLCRHLLKKYITDDPQEFNLINQYSKDFKSNYLYITSSDYCLNDTGYLKPMSVKEVLAKIKSKNKKD